MSFLLKSLSRAVHEEQQHQHDEVQEHHNTDVGLCTSLTVWRKSLVISCKGFTVFDSYGNLVYRVDNYIGRPDQVTLMDASGNSVLTMRRRRVNLGLIDSWIVYEGEAGKHCRTIKTPSCWVKKKVNILHSNPSVIAYVYREASDKRYAYAIQGSYSHRSCKVLDQSKRLVAEIKRKETITGGISFGIEVFQLIVHPGFDPGFAMGLVLLLDQMFS
ncbi:Protein LURP-one-related like [Quillaja saponaria]|uniref:Protein LURP-one-related like n=1 Tax=Quillaja saponaria TaxID=32244 RepID=A0AAD7KSR7_QUISA|nr:Protein LURP-one-related like [Quillaja saponaria]KAJ7944977.1 Protein LURP-one-related like [Quillaja saponaria]